MVLAKPGSAFGFKPQTSESTTEASTSDHRAVGGSAQPAEVAPDAGSGFEQAAQNEEREIAVGIDLDLELMSYLRIRDCFPTNTLQESPWFG